ncbi:MAG: hypothetical protein ACFE8N_13565 [Promethearchaeota archaeon]
MKLYSFFFKHICWWIMVIKDYGWIGLDGRDPLVRIPSVSKSIAMTLMYIEFLLEH